MPFRPAVRRLVATLARAGALAVAGAAITVLAAGPTAEPAFAAKKKASTARSDPASDSRYAAIVVDSATGQVLFARNADGRRYPASLTKIMTLYVLFEEMQKGKISETTRFEVSAKASAQAPSKLGLRPGQTITAMEAIKALVTKSANDAAMVVAENVSGSEAAFVARMNATAKRIGMMSTTFRNPNGLPNDRQVTTARDMATLGLAIQTRFPQEYKLFSTRSFVFRGATYGNHNRLLGRVEGVDGIKTGYIRASGFNLVTSVKRDGRQLVAVVMGGRTGRARDAHMADLVRTYLPKASKTRASQPLVAAVRGGWRLPEAVVADVAPEIVEAQASRRQVAVLVPPVPVAAPIRNAPAVAVARAEPETEVAPLAFAAVPSPAPVAPPAAPAQPMKLAGPSSSDVAAAKAQLTAMLQKFEEDQGDGADIPEETVQIASAEPAAALAQPAATQRVALQAQPRRLSRDGWKIQIGALPTETAAAARLDAARDQFARLLAKAEPYTEPVDTGSATLYRARFAGFQNQADARAACAQIKKRAYDCLPVLQ